MFSSSCDVSTLLFLLDLPEVRHGTTRTRLHVNVESTFCYFFARQIPVCLLGSKEGFEPNHDIFGPKGDEALS